jgi:uncharacterized cupredoxin-like copper-binding protein
MRRLVSVFAALPLVLATACGGRADASFGDAASASEAARTIEVATLDELAFDPATIDVSPGEVVTFRVTNPGELEHEFVLGPEEVQSEAEADAAHGGHAEHEDAGNAVVVAPGETAELTWRFADDVSGMLYGCHLPGHYAGGMRGEVTAAA